VTFATITLCVASQRVFIIIIIIIIVVVVVVVVVVVYFVIDSVRKLLDNPRMLYIISAPQKLRVKLAFIPSQSLEYSCCTDMMCYPTAGMLPAGYVKRTALLLLAEMTTLTVCAVHRRHSGMTLLLADS
jgi:hypothetical protein